ncbi:hypothetical protein [Mesorhizobium sp. Root172]|jgi:hypothetical protein|uniref:hypothetical protein n=1 Tax=Mesorhizobium sp. Root172 TaxID=1736481 RepID=UPI0012E3AE53|nr:hypothetical protein [Mesorhizobium sp. Root172]
MMERKGRFQFGLPKASSTGSAGKMLVGDLPRIAVGRSFLTDPVESVGGDLGKTPSGFTELTICT